MVVGLKRCEEVWGEWGDGVLFVRGFDICGGWIAGIRYFIEWLIGWLTGWLGEDDWGSLAGDEI